MRGNKIVFDLFLGAGNLLSTISFLSLRTTCINKLNFSAIAMTKKDAVPIRARDFVENSRFVNPIKSQKTLPKFGTLAKLKV